MSWSRRLRSSKIFLSIIGLLILVVIILAFTHLNGSKKSVALQERATQDEQQIQPQERAKEVLTKAPLSNISASPVENRQEEAERNGQQNNIALKLSGAGPGSGIMRKLSNFVRSVCRHSSVFLRFHVLADSPGKTGAGDVLNKMRQEGLCRYGFEVKHYDINELLNKGRKTIRLIMDSTQDARGRGRPMLFLLPVVLHQLLPPDIERIILFDSDFYFRSDIKDLFAHFDSFTEDNCFGAAYVQQPTYRYACRDYRATHPDTRLGGPPPDGVPGYNGGLVMLHLKNLRKSKLYSQILQENAAKKYAEKYQFRYWLGEQDFFLLLDMEHHELFYVLPCSWNRQTTYYLGLPQYAEFYDQYHDCPEPIHAYHGNAGARLPND